MERTNATKQRMRTVILIDGKERAGFSDDEIRSAVESAGDSTLLVDSSAEFKGRPADAIDVVRLSLQSFLTRTLATDAVSAKGPDHGATQAIWVLDTCGLTSRDIEKALGRVRSQVFDLPAAPRALVLEVDGTSKLTALAELGKAFGFSNSRGKLLKRATRRAWWMAMLLRVFGVRSSAVARPIAKVLAWPEGKERRARKARQKMDTKASSIGTDVDYGID